MGGQGRNEAYEKEALVALGYTRKDIMKADDNTSLQAKEGTR